LNRGNRKIGWEVDDSYVVFAKKLTGEKECETVRCRDATASSLVAKVRGEVFAHFHAVAVSGIDRLACQDEFFANSFLDVKKIMSMLLTFLFTSLAFSVSASLDFPCTAHTFFPKHLSNHFQGLLRSVSEICIKLDAAPLSGPSRNRIRPDTSHLIEGREKSARPPSYVDYSTLTFNI
jgi:hypothetical protein